MNKIEQKINNLATKLFVADNLATKIAGQKTVIKTTGYKSRDKRETFAFVAFCRRLSRVCRGFVASKATVNNCFITINNKINRKTKKSRQIRDKSFPITRDKPLPPPYRGGNCRERAGLKKQ